MVGAPKPKVKFWSRFSRRAARLFVVAETFSALGLALSLIQLKYFFVATSHDRYDPTDYGAIDHLRPYVWGFLGLGLGLTAIFAWVYIIDSSKASKSNSGLQR